MRKIDKTTILSTVYKAWEEELEKQGRDHPQWRANLPRSLDLIMNLFYCQQGLCAYTEIRLCPQKYLTPDNWKDGKYARTEKPQYFGQVEHFDKTLKEKKGWLWSNLFMVHPDINSPRVKGSAEVDDILKPDTEEYDPERLLEYDTALHVFIPHTGMPEDVQQKVKTMILTLGINFGPVKDSRERFLKKQFAMIEFQQSSWEDQPEEFPTAFEMCKKIFLETPAEEGI